MSSRMRFDYWVTSVVILGLVTLPAVGQTKLLRFPDIHEDLVVFCYAGDIWKAPASGGTATRLTAHPGQELFPKFSPDGRWIVYPQEDGKGSDIMLVEGFP